MKVLIATWDGGGNTPPFLALVDELRRRRHDVVVLTEASAASRWSARDVGFRRWGPDVEVARHNRMPEAERIPLILERLWFSASAALELRSALEADEFDACVIDHCLASCGAITESLGFPTAVLFHTVRRASRIGPPRFQDWLPALNAVRAAHGLGALATVADAWSFAAVRIVCSAHAFDAPHLNADARDLYVGAIAPVDPPDAPPTVDGDGPLVLVSFSTTWQDQVAALQKTIDGLAKLPVRALVTVGSEIDPSELQAPPSVLIVPFVAHSDVLPITDVVVTHAGHGTVMASLKAGVPLVCLPMGRDQYMNARLVEACGAGIQVAAADAIPPAVSRVLASPFFRASAERMAKEIASEPGVGAAVDAIEDLCR